jgi:hypothetical protein
MIARHLGWGREAGRMGEEAAAVFRNPLIACTALGLDNEAGTAHHDVQFAIRRHRHMPRREHRAQCQQWQQQRDPQAPGATGNQSSGTSNSATMLMILISGLMAGPAVSLYGSPTVSPVTAALCASEPLPPK